MTQPHGDTDFFISYRGNRRDWALWVNWVVRNAGYTTVLMEEFHNGTAWTDQMRIACDKCCRLIPLYSTDYWQSGACIAEFDCYWGLHMQDAAMGYLQPLEIEPCTLPRAQQTLLARRLQGLGRDEASAAVLEVVKRFTPVKTGGSAFTGPEPPFPAASMKPPPAIPVDYSDQVIPVDRDDFINCGDAFSSFEQMLVKGSPKRILLVHGHGNQGKSTLIALLYQHCRTHLPVKSAARIEFKKGSPPPEEHATAIARALGVPAPSHGSIDERIHSILDACLHRPVVLFFDAFEHAELQHLHWVNLILDRTLDDGRLRCVIAGREVPPHTSQPWRSATTLVECDALRDEAAILRHALAKGFKGKSEEITGFVAAFAQMRDRAKASGQHDPSLLSTQALLEEIQSYCTSGGLQP